MAKMRGRWTFDEVGAVKLRIGGTVTEGGPAVSSEITKAITAFTDGVAKDLLTVTVPNAAHGAIIVVTMMSALGAGGAIGAGEGTRISQYQFVLARTAGVACVVTASSAVGGAEAHVAGAASISSATLAATAMAGAVGAQQTFTIQGTITKSGGSSDNHSAVIRATVLNQNASGVSIA